MLKTELVSFLLKNYEVDLVALFETWFTSIITSGSILGDFVLLYSILRCDRIERRRGDVGVVIKLSLFSHLIYTESVPISYVVISLGKNILRFGHRVLLSVHTLRQLRTGHTSAA